MEHGLALAPASNVPRSMEIRFLDCAPARAPAAELQPSYLALQVSYLVLAFARPGMLANLLFAFSSPLQRIIMDVLCGGVPAYLHFYSGRQAGPSSSHGLYSRHIPDRASHRWIAFFGGAPSSVKSSHSVPQAL